jgi:threonine dehydrogenase-like Zn-dependent dehydrogenase
VIASGIEVLRSARIATDPLVSHRFALDDAAEAFRTAADPSSIKVMIHPQQRTHHGAG